MADDRRDLDVALRITKEGDAGAFKDTAEELHDLKGAATTAAPEVATLGTELESAGGSAKGAAEGVKHLGESFDSPLGRVRSFRAELNSAMATVRDAQQILAALEGGLNSLSEATGGAGDEFRGMSDVLPFLSRQIEEFRNLIFNGAAALRAFEDTEGSLTEKLEAATKAWNTDLAAVEKWKSTIEGASEKLDSQTEALVRAIDDVERSGEVTEQTSKRIAKAVDEQVEKYKDLEKDVPPALQAVADKYQVVDDAAKQSGETAKRTADDRKASAAREKQAIDEVAAAQLNAAKEAEKAAAQQKAAVDQLVERITGIPQEVQPSLEQLGEALSGALSKIDFGALNTEQLERARETFQQFVDQSREAGEQVPQDIADQAAALGVMVGAMEVAGGASSSLSGAQDGLSASSVQLVEKIDATGKKSYELKQGLEQAGAAAGRAGEDVASGAETAGESISVVDEIKQKWADLKKSQAEAGDAAGRAGEDVKSGADAAADGSEGLTEAATAAKEAGAGLKEAKEGAEGLGGAAGASKAGIDTMVGSLERLAVVKEVAKELDALNQVKFTGLVSEFGAVESSIDRIISKAGQARTALDSIDQAGGG